MTIAHISDLHLNPEYKRQNIRNTRRLLDYISRKQVDHVVLTGDVASNAETRDFEVGRSLLEGAGLLDPIRLSVVIGNHDIYGGVHTAEDILTYLHRCRTVDYNARVGKFTEYYREAFERSIVAPEPHVFPFAKLVGEVLIVGLNSVARYSDVKNPLGSNGKIERRQLDRLDEILSSPLFRNRQKVVLVHHHFSRARGPASGTMHTIWNRIERQTMKLRGKKKLLKMFRGHKVGIVLHGHNHTNAQYSRSGVRFLNGGGSVIHEAGGGLRVNLLRVWPDSILTEVHRLPEGTGMLVRTADIVERRETTGAVAA